MSKTLNDIEMLFEETPIKKRIAKLPTAKSRHNPLQGVSSWKLVRELLSRHYVDLQVTAFWVLLAALVYIKLGK